MSALGSPSTVPHFPYHNTVLLVDEYLYNVAEMKIGHIIGTLNMVLLQLLHRYDFPSDLIETLVIPLFVIEDKPIYEDEEPDMKYGPALQVMLDSLAHPNCPPVVLHVACQSSNSSHGFAQLASKHPNCPEEDRVYFALKYGPSRPRAANLGMLTYKYSWANGR